MRIAGQDQQHHIITLSLQ